MPRREAVHSVYALIDPRDNLIHYIGRTCDARRRLQVHMLNTSERESEDKKRWITDLKHHSLTPILIIIMADLTSDEAAKQERLHIMHYLELGMPLKNKRIAYRPYAPKHKPADHLLTAKDIAKRLGVHPNRARSMLQHGLIKSVNAGFHWKVKPEDLQEYIDSRPEDKK